MGVGLIAQTAHLPNLDLLRDKFVISQVCDASIGLATRIAKGLADKPTVTDNWMDVCTNSELDAVLILTPGGHGEQVEVALDSGLHVLSEKPLCYTPEEAFELAAKAVDAGLVLQVGYMKMYDPILPKLRELMAKVGTIRSVRVTVLHPADEVQYDPLSVIRSSQVNAAVLESGMAYHEERVRDATAGAPPELTELYANVLLGSVVHELSLLRAVGFELPEAFDYAAVSHRSDAVHGEPPCISAYARFNGDAQLHLSWNWLPDYPEYGEELAIFGTAGRLYLDMPGPYFGAQRATLTVKLFEGDVTETSDFHAFPRTAFFHELNSFYGAVVDGTPIVADANGAGEDTRCLQALLAAIGESHERGSGAATTREVAP